jgi:hypothetical protein
LLSRAYSALGNTDEAELEKRTAQTAMDRIGAGVLRHEPMAPELGHAQYEAP